MNEAADSEKRSIDPSAWLDQYGDYLYRYALSRLRDAESAEEVVQETFVSALRARDQFAGKGTEQAWLVGILKRKIVDLVRKRNRATSAHGSDMDEDLSETLFDNRGHWRVDPRVFGSNPQSILESREFWSVFRACLAKLPQRQADVFTLREMDDRTGAEICKELDVSASNLWVLLYRARVGLSRCLKSNWHTQGGR